MQIMYEIGKDAITNCGNQAPEEHDRYYTIARKKLDDMKGGRWSDQKLKVKEIKEMIHNLHCLIFFNFKNK